MKIKKSIVSAATACVLSVGTLFSGACSFGVSAVWDTSGGDRYYLDEDGDKLTGFQEIDGDTYYFDSKGVMKTGWLKFKSGRKYYFDKEGKMVTGKKTISGKTYYFGKDGVMKTGWLKSGDNKYYFKTDGSMAKDCTLKINGKSYKFDKNGKLETSSSSSSSSSVKKNTEPKEFVMPKFGSGSKKVLSECGIADYEKIDTQDDGATMYGGMVLVDGDITALFVSFNENDELFAVYLYIPCSYSNYDDLVDDFVDELGDYDMKTDDCYYWFDSDTEGLMLSFVETDDYDFAMIIIMDIDYCSDGFLSQ